MNYFYAQLNSENIVFCVNQSLSKINDDTCIAITKTQFDAANQGGGILGKKHQSGEFVETL